MSSRSPTFYVWTEDWASRGSTEIGSALLNYLDLLDYDGINLIRLFCDGCAGQNKNSHIIHTLIYWLRRSPQHVTEITLTFPVRGHSFMAADRSFGRVEKILRKNPVITSKDEYIKIYNEVGTTKTLGKDWQIYDIKGLENIYKKVAGISDTKRISLKKIRKANQSTTEIKVTTYNHYRFQSGTEVGHSLLKKGKQDDQVPLNQVKYKHCLPDKKKKSLRHLMQENFGNNWESRADLIWYKNLLKPVSSDEEDRPEVEGGENCDCLHHEPAIPI